MTRPTNHGLSSEDLIYLRVGLRIKELRSLARITQFELAEAVGVSRASIANIEAGRQRTPLFTYVLIANVLGVTMRALVDDALAY